MLGSQPSESGGPILVTVDSCIGCEHLSTLLDKNQDSLGDGALILTREQQCVFIGYCYDMLEPRWQFDSLNLVGIQSPVLNFSGPSTEIPLCTQHKSPSLIHSYSVLSLSAQGHWVCSMDIRNNLLELRRELNQMPCLLPARLHKFWPTTLSTEDVQILSIGNRLLQPKSSIP